MFQKLKQKLSLGNKGEMGLGMLVNFISLLVIAVIFLGIGLYVLAEVMGQVTDATASGAINESIQAVATIPGWLGILVVVVMASLIIGVVITAFALRGSRR